MSIEGHKLKCHSLWTKIDWFSDIQGLVLVFILKQLPIGVNIEAIPFFAWVGPIRIADLYWDHDPSNAILMAKLM